MNIKKKGEIGAEAMRPCPIQKRKSSRAEVDTHPERHVFRASMKIHRAYEYFYSTGDENQPRTCMYTF